MQYFIQVYDVVIHSFLKVIVYLSYHPGYIPHTVQYILIA